ncbi:MAG: ATP-binding cassette domain-containing protein [Candidatus Pacebacteria bacterium]|nr:ATP-binding cassette domain-containing protein [Candidatus Paceibacterota bacterium]
MFKRIWQYTKPYRRTLYALAVLISIMASLKQVGPLVSKRVTDAVLITGQDRLDYIIKLLVLLLIVKLIQVGLNRLTWYMTNIFVVRLETHLKKIGFDHLMGLSLTYFNEQATGKVMSKLDRGVNRIVNIVNNSGMHFLPSVTAALISFAIVIRYEWRIALLVVLGFIPYIAINRWRFEKNNKLERKEYKLYDAQYSHFWEVLNAMPLIKAFRAENYERQQLNQFFDKYLDLRQEMEDNTNKAVFGDVFLELSIWAMYAYIVYITWQGQLTIGTMVMLVGLIDLIREPLWQLNWIFWEIKRAQIGARDFFRIMRVDEQVPEPQEPVELGRVEGRIEFEQVSFTYKNVENAQEIASLGLKKDGRDQDDQGQDEWVKIENDQAGLVEIERDKGGLIEQDEVKETQGGLTEQNEAKKDQVKLAEQNELKKDKLELATHNKASQSQSQRELKVLDGVSFTIEPNQMTAFVGPSGSGKTTVASLVMRFFDPDSGKIKLDGVSLKQISKNELRSYIGLVSQDSHLFATTIADNLRYAKPDATEQEMWQACQVAYADQFIKDLPLGLKTEIGERGVKLSGGQKQRLSLARTILANPEIIILDEATSSLDSQSEVYIQKALAKLLADKTSIVIAHRLSTIQQADKIIVLQDQQVLEQGNHQELIEQDGLYASLFKIQAGDTKLLEEWDLIV